MNNSIKLDVTQLVMTDLNTSELDNIQGGELHATLAGSAASGAYTAGIASMGYTAALSAAGLGILATMGVGAVVAVSGALVFRAAYEAALAAEAVYKLSKQ